MAPESATENLLPAHDALVRIDRRRLTKGDIAFSGTEPNRSPLARHELRPALLTSERTALEASCGPRRALEHTATLFARSHHSTIGEGGTRTIREAGGLPCQVIRPSVAWAAERPQIVQTVCLIMRRKQAERRDVMDRYISIRSALTTLPAIPLQGCTPLSCPTRTTVASVPAAPHRILRSRKLAWFCTHDETIAPYGAYVK